VISRFDRAVKLRDIVEGILALVQACGLVALMGIAFWDFDVLPHAVAFGFGLYIVNRRRRNER
jgi:hypothetical protein